MSAGGTINNTPKTAGAGSRLLRYALQYKRRFTVGLAMLAVAVFAELCGPFIAKTMIDTHILGIEKTWYEITAPTGVGDAGNTIDPDGIVGYRDKQYVRSDKLPKGAEAGREVRVIQTGKHFVFVNEPLRFDGERSLTDGSLVVRKDGNVASYAVQTLSPGELFAFYKPEVRGLIELAGLYLLLLAVASAFHYGQKYFLQTAANRIVQKLRLDLYKQIQRLPINYFDNMPAGKVVSRVTNDTEAVKDLFVSVLTQFFSGAINMIGIYAALFLLSPRLAAICLVIIPLLVAWIWLYRKYAGRYNQIIRARISDLNGIINESIQGMTVIRAFRRQKQTMDEFEALNTEYFVYQNKMQHLNALTSFNLVNVLKNFAFAGVVWYFGGGSFTFGGAITFGVLYAFIDYLGRLFQPLNGMVNQLGMLEQARIAAQRVFELIDEQGTDVAQGQLPRYQGNVRFDNVWFAYKDDYVLRGISFEAKQGQTVALVGHTGSGKSSIMNLLFRFYDPQRGTITIDGQDTSAIPKQPLREHMGIVLQDPYLFTGTVASNVSLNDPAISRAQVEQALNDVGAAQILAGLPKGYDEPVLEKGATLSAGQRQLISFARALAFNPAILILDEATSSIDTETEAVIQNALEVLKKGRTTFIIAHRLSTIRSADLILVLHRGEIVERGTHESLLGLQGRYAQMYRLQQGAS